MYIIYIYISIHTYIFIYIYTCTHSSPAPHVIGLYPKTGMLVQGLFHIVDGSSCFCFSSHTIVNLAEFE